MEKILKRILLSIPILLFTFSLTPVKAESNESLVDIDDFTVQANTNFNRSLGTLLLEAGTTYYYSYTQENSLTSVTRNTPYFQNSGQNIYQSTSINYNLQAGRKVWEFTPQVTGIYSVGFWCHTPSNNVTFSDFIISTSKPTPDEPTPDEPTPETPGQDNLDLHYFYVPNYNEKMCVEILDKDTIRVFENENSIDYIDYFINSNYISKTGQVGLDYIKNCSNLKFSSIEYYRNDFPKILFITIVIFGSSVLFLYVLYKRFRKR